jgi:hypothetical protein
MGNTDPTIPNLFAPSDSDGDSITPLEDFFGPADDEGDKGSDDNGSDNGGSDHQGVEPLLRPMGQFAQASFDLMHCMELGVRQELLVSGL